VSVGVAELGRERDAHQVECLHGAVRVDGELREVVVAHHLLHVGEHRVGPLGKDPVTLVQDFVQDLDALVWQTNFVRVGVHQRPAHLRRVPRLGRRVQLTADVLDRLAHGRQQRLQAGEEGLDGHGVKGTSLDPQL